MTPLAYQRVIDVGRESHPSAVPEGLVVTVYFERGDINRHE